MKPDQVGPSHRRRTPRQPRGRAPVGGSSGFNLVELVLVLAITALVSAIAVPRYAKSVSRYRADSAARRVAADLALAQSHASTAGKPQSVVFVARGYQMPGMPHLDGKSYGDYTVDLGADPYGVSRVAAEFGGDAVVKFDLYGAPDTGGSVVLTVGDFRRVIVLAPESGKVVVK
jgi:prepilin-type N-terminal cleavage/methylation domain-containing protein